MRFARRGLVVLVAVAVSVGVGLIASARWSLRAQERAGKASVRAKGELASPRAVGSISVQDALLRPLDLPFGEETTLEEVRQHLARVLGAPVVLDRSALDRLELTPEDTVQLELKGVRLKVGLKLLLDQVGLSFRVVPEDNLLILTDPEESDDAPKRILAELKALRRDIYDLQESVDDLRDLVEEDLGVEPETTKHRSTLVRLGKAKQAPRRSGRMTRPTSPAPGVGG